MKYKHKKIPNCGPRNGFFIKTPNGRVISDTNPQVIIRELNDLLREIHRLEQVGWRMHNTIKQLGFESDSQQDFRRISRFKP